MIGKLKGIVDQIDLDSVLLDVNGVCYQVYCTVKTLQNLEIGKNSYLYIETYVREDSIKLFGFATIAEKEIFLLLQSVNGVGAKMSLGILSKMNIDDFHNAIATRNKDLLVTIPGVGAKTAERIIVELKNKKFFSTPSSYNQSIIPNDLQDAVSALMSLGLTRNEAVTYVDKVLANDPQAKIDDIIKQALILRSR
jgi:Holliday junction DNA helicase RuvA